MNRYFLWLCSVNDKSIVLRLPTFFKWSNSKEAERLRSIFTTPYTYLYFSGLSLRKTSEHLLLPFVKRNHVLIQSGIGYNIIINQPTKKVWQKKRMKISQFIIIDEIVIRVGKKRRISSSLVIDGLQLNLKVNQFWICMTYFSRKEHTYC